MFLYVVQGLLIVLFVTFMVTQVIYPLINRRPLFPLFIPSQSDLIDGIKTVGQLEDEQKLAAELQERISKLIKKGEM